MKTNKGWIIGLLAGTLLTGYGCEDQPVKSTQPGQEQATALQEVKGKAHIAADHEQRNFRTHLKGRNEVPPVETKAEGQALFKVNKEGTSIYYKLLVSNIENVLMAHIHVAPPDENGGVVVWLYPASPPPKLIEGPFQGVLAEGEITADDLTGALEGATLDALIDEMEAGNTYVNVHTTQHPSGEVRGQIE
ncbi:CHRD domain-containing protein [Fodinibius sediminis]|uniref:CHRD domain-containing protein n=1 Tax=Fodinibius sediminis TaxID=1214077 RepID=A0A521CM50_9BACT|nr:CHRD domain-containing protein [Fodinibius sediminis]SMO60435.1 CHRD domain-containing protein [Fodinibius sediminis]